MRLAGAEKTQSSVGSGFVFFFAFSLRVTPVAKFGDRKEFFL